ncbi:hypothetical protein AB3X91_16005 [Paraburkholderia sp. BR14263]|uniref:hypothetical protein n=1 Tax=unclassified Paraburkholderia TaxID=2615204 RepID=UPI0034CDFA22
MKLTTRMLVDFDGQDVFDSVAWPLLHQNARSTAFDSVRCMYRAPDGKRCAVGWLMPDSIYSKALEFFSVKDVAARLIERHDAEATAYAHFLHAHHNLLVALQEMHDARRPDEWPAELRKIAMRFHLNAGVVTHCERLFGRVVHLEPVEEFPQATITFKPSHVYLLDKPKRDDWASRDMPAKRTTRETDDVLA